MLLYTPILASVKHMNISADELILLNLDRSKLLEAVLTKEDPLLGQLQFSFIAFMPLRTRTQMFVKFIRVIYSSSGMAFNIHMIPEVVRTRATLCFWMKHGFQETLALQVSYPLIEFNAE